VAGLVRVYVTAPDGRTMTVRCCRPGALIGVVSLFASPFSLPATIQAVTEADLLAFRPSVAQRAAERDAGVARALIDELSERALSFIAEIPGSAFATVRQRVTRHLLDLASESQTGSELVAEIGQQNLADAVGSVRRSSSCAAGAPPRGSCGRNGTQSCSSTPGACLSRPVPARLERRFRSSATIVADSRARPRETLHDEGALARRDRWPIPGGGGSCSLPSANRGMPLEVMREDLTPTGLQYLVAHWDRPALDPASWRLRIDGCVREPVELAIDDIRAGRPRCTIAVTLECAGNGRWLTRAP
jgi:Oxidoreductase molybdopterin binding domain/Cyclic nucleotide-binding domain